MMNLDIRISIMHPDFQSGNLCLQWHCALEIMHRLNLCLQ